MRPPTVGLKVSIRGLPRTVRPSPHVSSPSIYKVTTFSTVAGQAEGVPRYTHIHVISRPDLPVRDRSCRDVSETTFLDIPRDFHHWEDTCVHSRNLGYLWVVREHRWENPIPSRSSPPFLIGLAHRRPRSHHHDFSLHPGIN